MEYIMLDAYLKSNIYKPTKENEEYLTKDLTHGVFSEWNDKLEAFTHICDFYDYVFRFYEDGRIVMEDRLLDILSCAWYGKNDGRRHLEYLSIDDMLKDWLEIIKKDERAQCILKDKIEFIERLE